MTREKERNGFGTEHVDCIIENLQEDLNPEQRRQVTEFINENASAFSRSEFDLGRTELITHAIDTEGVKPFKQQLRRHPATHLEIIDEHVNKMLEHGIISPTSSPRASNVVLVRKSSGNLRFCIDFRQLNLCTVKDIPYRG